MGRDHIEIGEGAVGGSSGCDRRGRPRLTCCLAAAVLLAAPAGLTAQASPHSRLPDEGETFCGQLFLRAEGRTFGHEFVIFVPGEGPEDDPDRIRAALPERSGAERPAVWWRLSPDSVGARLAGEEGTVWELRLGSAGTSLGGALRRVLPPDQDPDVARAFTLRTPCP